MNRTVKAKIVSYEIDQKAATVSWIVELPSKRQSELLWATAEFIPAFRLPPEVTYENIEELCKKMIGKEINVA